MEVSVDLIEDREDPRDELARHLEAEAIDEEIARTYRCHYCRHSPFGACPECERQEAWASEEAVIAAEAKVFAATVSNKRDRDCVCGRLFYGGPDDMCGRCESDSYSR